MNDIPTKLSELELGSSQNSKFDFDINSNFQLGRNFQTAIQKEIKDYLKHNLEIDIFRWKESDSITAQVSLDGKVLSEKTCLLT